MVNKLWKKIHNFFIEKIKIAVFTHVIIQQFNYNNIKEVDMNPTIMVVSNGCKSCITCSTCTHCGPALVLGTGIAGVTGFF